MITITQNRGIKKNYHLTILINNLEKTGYHILSTLLEFHPRNSHQKYGFFSVKNYA